jgi:hypothetical protein
MDKLKKNIRVVYVIVKINNFNEKIIECVFSKRSEAEKYISFHKFYEIEECVIDPVITGDKYDYFT